MHLDLVDAAARERAADTVVILEARPGLKGVGRNRAHRSAGLAGLAVKKPVAVWCGVALLDARPLSVAHGRQVEPEPTRAAQAVICPPACRAATVTLALCAAVAKVEVHPRRKVALTDRVRVILGTHPRSASAAAGRRPGVLAIWARGVTVTDARAAPISIDGTAVVAGAVTVLAIGAGVPSLAVACWNVVGRGADSAEATAS